MVQYAGFAMPVEFSGVITENLATRNAAALFDVGHMGEFWVKGPKALDLLQYVTTNDVSLLHPGKAQYSCLPNGRGGIVDDLIIYHYEHEKYMLVVNAANIEKDWSWISEHNTFGAELENASDEMSMIALQGPKAGEILSQLTDYDLSSLKSFEFVTTTVAGTEHVIISATGYTGAGGFELYCYNTGANNLWKALLEVGAPLGIKPAGLAARDTLRLEMGYSLYGNDIDDTTSPIEAGLDWIVKLGKPAEFIDKELYQKQKADGTVRKLVAFKMIDRGIPRHDYPICDKDGNEIGKVTSGTQSPNLNCGIGMGYVRTEFSETGSPIYLSVRNKLLEAQVVKLPFLKK